MILAHIFLPAMLLVICRSQQAPAHLTSAYGTEESVYGNPSANNDPMASPAITNNDELLGRYRQLTAKSLLRLYDSCKVHDFIQNLKHNMETDIDDEESMKLPGLGKEHQQRYINTLLRILEKQQAFDNDVTLLFPTERAGETTKSALYYYLTILILLQDKELDEMLNNMLYEKCCKTDVNFFSSSICARDLDDSIAQKRNTIKKVKFHSWGGKRNGGNSQSNSRMPTNVDLSKDVGQSKIVIRAPFRPWGGRK
ncbi:leucokinins-like [Contarinia nasturtii]|uniref:leucokinins-like n=1 Tax=Contarinia nasturtii TaxID=265458 RepID=UPI0012D48B0D|nr:leucokinins-like [Contarinia nasturtii]XP_031635760.1 leucokinins-like [Contarinia nasturtii]XP_031635761.1 leucokinins-like [Contarinia nasturtii]